MLYIRLVVICVIAFVIIKASSSCCGHTQKNPTNSQIGNGYKKLAGTFSLVSEPAKWNHHRKAMYTPSFVHTVPGTAETSETLGVGHFLLHCESSPALQ